METLCQDRALSLFGLDAEEWAVRMDEGGTARSKPRLHRLGCVFLFWFFCLCLRARTRIYPVRVRVIA